MKKDKVDFFIVGAAKCGTSALVDYLAQHKAIFIPEEKELHYFGKDLTYSVPRITKENYETLFAKANEKQQLGDASVTYLLSTQAAKEIYSYNPKAKIIICTRPSIDMVYSLHSELVYGGMEPEEDFVKALKLENKRKQGLHLPKQYSNPIEFLYYSQVAQLEEQIQRYKDVFPSSQLLVLEQHRLKEHPQETLHEVCQLLEVETIPFTHLVSNPNKKVKHKKWGNLLNHMPSSIKTISRYIIPIKSWRKKIYFGMKDSNTHYIQREKMPLEALEILKKYYSK